MKIIFPMLLLLAACASKLPAPVVEGNPANATTTKNIVPKPTIAEKVTDSKHVIVKPGDTLIAIALEHGLDYRELGAWNKIENLNVIQVGQELRIVAPEVPVVATPLIVAAAPVAVPMPPTASTPSPSPANALPAAATAKPAPSPPAAMAAASSAAFKGEGDVDWAWPLHQPGKMLAMFTEVNKGIDMAGSKGTSVLAAAAGKVIYAQAGLRGYGKLVIVKHNDLWLSTYAHNDKLLVMEGQEVKKGQAIAEMGSTDTDSVKLHFEIRKQGKPVDPIKMLPPL